MTLAQLIPLVIQISIGLIVFSVALSAGPGDVTYLLRRPSLLIRSVLSMNVIMPVVAVVIAISFKLRPEVEAALLILSVSPVPPILPSKESKAGGSASYAIGLLAIAALLAIVTVPASVSLIGRLLGRSVNVPMALIAKVVIMSVLGPLALGAAVRRVAPTFAERGAKPLSMAGTIMLLLALIPVGLKAWPAVMAQIGDFTVVAIGLFVVLSLAVGHLLGGPDDDDRTVLALSTASRHPGVAMAVAGAAVLPENRPIVSAAVLLAVVVGVIVTTPYVLWRKRSPAGAPPSTKRA